MIKLKCLFVAIILSLILAIAAPVYAFDPADPTANATAEYVFTDNFTITFGGPLNFSMDLTAFTDALGENMIDASEAHAQIIADTTNDIASDFILLAIIALIIALVFWQHSPFLYALGFIVALTYGIEVTTQQEVYSSYWMAGLVIALIGTYFLYCIVAIGFDWLRKKE